VLPCSKLRQLDLDHMSVQLLPTVGGLFPGILRDASRLTRFTLQNASVIGGPQALTGELCARAVGKGSLASLLGALADARLMLLV
jgi:hypothetical protein